MKLTNIVQKFQFTIEWFDSVDSTNRVVAERKSSLADGTCIAALEQTAGRGQKGNSWATAKGENLTFSLLYRPKDIPVQQQFCISQAVAVGLSNYLKAKGIDNKIKWPNDIYAGDLKICGVLIENSLKGAKVGDCIIGIGLNVNQTQFPAEIPNPTSMKMLSGEDYDIKKELPELLRHIGAALEKIEEPYTRNGLDAEYLRRLYRRGEWHMYEALPSSDIPTEKRSGKPFEARILGIDNAARLLLEQTDGTLKYFSFKEIKYLLS